MKRLVILFILLLPGVAAHAEPTESDPAPGARLDAAPLHVIVHFSEPVYGEGSFIVVEDLAGLRVDDDDLDVRFGARPVMTIGTSQLGDGAYRIRWQTYSESDGHVITGVIGFAVGGFAPPPTTTVTGEGLGIGGFARGVLDAAFSLALGTLAYAAFVRRDRLRLRDHRLLAASGAGATMALLVLYHETASEAGVGVRDFIDTEGGAALAARVAVALGAWAVAVAALLWRRELRWAAPLLAAIWVAAAYQSASFGHITADYPTGVIVELIHLVAMAVWIGGLVHVLLDLRRPVDEVRRFGARFSTIAIICVAAIASTGLLLTLLLLGAEARAPATWSTAWGVFLAAKIVAFAAMLGLAILNRYIFLDPPRERGAVASLQRRVATWTKGAWQDIGLVGTGGMRRVMAAEVGFGAAVLVCAGFLLSLSPPAEAVEGLDVVQLTGAEGEVLVTLRLAPTPTIGTPTEARLYISLDDGTPVEANTCGTGRDDCLRLEVHAGAVEERALVPEGGGWWRTDNLIFAGNVTIEIVVQTQYIFEERVTFAVPVQAKA